MITDNAHRIAFLEKRSVWLLLTGLAVGIGAITAFSLTLNHDVAWCLHAAGRMADGARLYTDLIELNPPLIIWLSLPPVLLARATGASEIVLFQGYIFSLVLLSLALCRSLAERAFPLYPRSMRGLFIMLLALFFIPWEDYGQREHIMLLLVMPYLLSAIARSLGRPAGGGMSLVVGLMAGVGLAIKPYFLLLWIAVEIHLWRTGGARSLRRSENLAITGVLLCYGVAVAAITPAYFTVVRMAMEAYGAYNCRFTTLFNRTGATVCGLALLTAGLLRLTPADRDARRVLLIATLAFFAGAVMQHKGWGYHYYPGDIAGRLFIALSLWGLLERLPAADALFWNGRRGVVLASALMVLLAAGLELRAMRSSPPVGMDLLPALRRYAAGEYVTYISTTVAYPFPAVNYAGARWGSRFPALWLLPAAYMGVHPRPDGSFPYHRRDEMGELERYTVDALVEDLRRYAPALIVVDRHAEKQAMEGSGFDYLDYFSRDPRFATIVAGYDSLSTIDSMLLLRRRDPAVRR